MSDQDEKQRERAFVPALSRFGALYDPVVALTCREGIFRPRIIEQLNLRPGLRVLDLGCGTGTLAVAIAKAEPGVSVVAVDADESALRRARRKAEEAGVFIEWVRAFADETGLPCESFDRVVSTLFFHHLSPEDKWKTLEQARCLLKMGGELHILDWGRPTTVLHRLGFLGIQLVDGFENTQDHVAGNLTSLVRTAGFSDVESLGSLDTMWGTLDFIKAVRAE
ncbi:MAG: class I SAM-dependent methyltransferase [Myxococcales bacterium]|nr:class I SAM-dependent methyltransferase [Myxococcales bacterium]